MNVFGLKIEKISKVQPASQAEQSPTVENKIPKPNPYAGIVGKTFAVVVRAMGDEKKTDLESLVIGRLVRVGAIIRPMPDELVKNILETGLPPLEIKSDYLLVVLERHYFDRPCKSAHDSSRRYCQCDYRVIMPDGKIIASGIVKKQHFPNYSEDVDLSQEYAAEELLKELAEWLVYHVSTKDQAVV